MPGACMICTVMYGSGFKIAIMAAMRVHLLMVLRGSLRSAVGASGVVVRGAADRGPRVRRIATGASPASGSAASVFELPGIFSSYELSEDDYMDGKQAKEAFRRML